MNKDNNNKLIVIGAGLCGSLLAIRLAQRGYRVALYESRGDMRKTEMKAGRSINLALSDRGLRGLRLVGLEEKIRKLCIPMYGRMIHTPDGQTRFSKYSGREGEYINSVSRGGLNMTLLDKAEEYENVNIQFNARCFKVDLKRGMVNLRNPASGVGRLEVADAIFGADGAGSVVRASMFEETIPLLFNFSQDFLRHGYKELSIPPGPGGSFRIEKNALHIWPRGTYMLIALPNLDGSFTVTLFLPYEGEFGFDNIDTGEKILNFFKEHFPDVVPHMPTLVEDYFENPVGTLGTIKCYPWQAYGKVLLMGDAAHAIVPFYGQGMNACFEDVVVFDQILDRNPGDWGSVFSTFQEVRKKDTDAIADLAVDNFLEMRDHVANPVFVKKRQLETLLEDTFSDYFSKYSLVTFNEDIPYSRAMEKGRAQDAFLMELCEKVDNVEDLDLKEVLEKVKFVSGEKIS